MSKICIPWQLLLNAFGYSKTHGSRWDLCVWCEVRDSIRWGGFAFCWVLLGWAEFDAGTCWLPVSFFGMSNNIPHNCRRRRRRTVCNGNANRGTAYSYCRLESREREIGREARRVAAGCSSLWGAFTISSSGTQSLLREASFHISSYTLKIAIGIGSVDGRCAAIR